MKCVNHLDKDAISVCNHCGKSICADCSVQINNEYTCKDCSAKVIATPSKATHSPGLAVFLSIFFAGLGQCYNGQFGKAVLIFFTSWLFIPWVISIFDAYSVAKKIRDQGIVLGDRTKGMITFVVGTFVFTVVAIGAVILLIVILVTKGVEKTVVTNESQAEMVLKSISSAIQDYTLKNNGALPLGDQDVIGSGLTSFSSAINDQRLNGYIFNTEFSASGYKVIANPDDCGLSGRKVFTLDAAGVTSQPCKVKEN